jgi:hypothetical protein
MGGQTDKFSLVIILIVLLIVFYMYSPFTNENFQNQNREFSNQNREFNSDSIYNFHHLKSDKDDKGIYNYFYGKYMNPYSQPMNQFFTNDKVGMLEKNN